METKRLKILIASPEVVPFAKTGGLADVCGALPKALAKLGHQVKVILPKYRMVDEKEFKLSGLKTDIPLIPVGDKNVKITVKNYNLPSPKVEYLFVVCDEYYDREELYKDQSTGFDYKDNDERFVLFARGTLEILKARGWQPDIVHANDWQSALMAAYLKTIYADDPFFEQTASVFSIHNLAYQGNFPKSALDKIGVSKDLFYPASAFEFWGNVNFMKAGISYADVMNTVSETYAVEIQSSSEFGHGLEGVLRTRNADLYGIVNGIDYDVWSPEKDKLISYNYSLKDISNKRKNKELLLKLCNLPLSSRDIPLIGIISRLADQKGFDLLAKIGDELLSLDLQLVILGTGEEKYHRLFKEMRVKCSDKISVNLGFDNPLAHLIEAGSDMFLMPSRYEPCGLNQLYSLKYGTVPIVRKTGGLADTIENYDLQTGEGTGFVFKNYDASELMDTIKLALRVYKEKDAWLKLMKNGMKKDFSWETAAKKYVEIYQKAIQKMDVVDV
ncbi:MAG: glycogen synthase [candidate division Zixibacteria bacterium SM23_73_3]|nr:MAG: glycogen synthase [candidate division Zixibacteria bacterium SM23_73_3]